MEAAIRSNQKLISQPITKPSQDTGGSTMLQRLQKETGELIQRNADLVQQLRAGVVSDTGSPLESFGGSTGDGGGGGGRATGRAVDLLKRANLIDAAQQPYKWGGGHGAKPTMEGPWDCSGAVSAVLGVDPRVSGQFARWGAPGRGKQVTIYANDEHVLMEINGRFFGTSKTNPGGGAGWIPRSAISKQYLARFTARHPQGL